MVFLVFALAWHSLVSLVSVALAKEQYSHILLVLPIAIALLLSETTGQASERPSLSAGVAVLSMAGGLALIASRYPQLLSPEAKLPIAIFCVVLALLGCVMTVYGINELKRNAFVFLFLFLLVPLPEASTDAVISWLQDNSARLAYTLFFIAGIPVSRDGFVLHLPKIDIEVASECSGIRSTMILTLTSLVLGHLFLRASWRQAVLFACTVFISVLKNALRIFTLSVLAIYIDYSWIEGNFHHRYGGGVFFALGLAMVMGALSWLRRTEGAHS
jgi:exosortase